MDAKNCSNDTTEYGAMHKSVYATSLLIIMVFACIANIVALFTILRVQSLRQTPHNMLILNLAVADLGRALLVMPFPLTSVFDGGDYLKGNDEACKALGFFTLFFVYINLMTIAFIAVDRVIVVTSCNKCGISDWTRVRIMLAFAWVIAGIIALLPTLDKLSTIEYLPPIRTCSVKINTFGTFTMGIMLSIVFPTMVVSYTIIAVLLWKRDQKLTRRRRRGLRATVVARPARPVPTSPVGLRKVTFDMRHIVATRQSVDLEKSEEQKTTNCRVTMGNRAASGINSLEHSLQDKNTIDAGSGSQVETCEVPLAWKRKEAIKRNRNGLILADGHLPSSNVPPTEGGAPVRYGLGARLSALLNIKKEPSVPGECADGEQENCVIKGFKSAHGTGFTPGTSIYPAGTGDEDPGVTFRTVIETKTRRLSNLFGSLKGIVGIGNYGREDDGDDFTENYSDRDDEQTCDMDSEPSHTMTTYSMSPSMADFATDKDAESVDDVVRSPRVRRRSRKTKLEKLRNMRQRRVAMTGVLLVCCNIFFAAPLAIWSFLKCPPVWYGVPLSWLAYCTTIADPLVYAFMNRRVKKELRMYKKVIANSLPCKSKAD